jgi:hypothetical protein
VSFFVTSATSVTGNLGGLSGADATCQRLAAAAGYGDRNWRAYLSVERNPANNNQPTHARDRIGTGPGTTSISSLSRTTTPSCTRERATRPCSSTSVVGGSTDSGPVRHVLLNTTSTRARTRTARWLRASRAPTGHPTPPRSLRSGYIGWLGPNQSTAGTLASWNVGHTNLNCSNTAPRGGAGRFYCFAR